MAASMVTAYYDKSALSDSLFAPYKLAKTQNYKKYLNTYDVISLNMQNFLSNADHIDGVIRNINTALIKEIAKAYPDAEVFDEFSMENPGELAEFVGFTEEEVKECCKIYHIDFDMCREWYDGYSFPKCKSVYNPKSIVSLMRSGEFSDYWNHIETYEALKVYINLNYDGIRDDILAMMSENRVKIDTGSFTNDLTTFSNADDVMTLLVHLGYLAYDFHTKEVFIPNKEIMQEFVTTTASGSWNEIIKSIKKSDTLLQATWDREEDKVAEYIEVAHFETSHLQYNDENALSYVVSLAYYSARQYYTVIRELPSGKGFADLAFLPKNNDKPGIIVELKWDKTAETAISQIKQKKYTGVLSDFLGVIFLVGINYSKKTRKHECIIEEGSETV